MKISVIIPTFSRADMLPRAIHSVLDQQGVDVEVVVVNDNPPSSPERERTREAVQAIGDARLLYVENEKNLGGSLTRNQGILASSGAYISFLDDDDYYRPGKLSEQLAFTQGGGFDLTFMDCEIQDEHGHTLDLRTHRLPEAPDQETLLRTHLLSPLTPTMTYMFRREALLKLGLFDNRPVSQEYMLMLRAIEGNLKIGYLARALSVQVVHGGERISFGANKIEGEKRLLQEKMRYRHLLTRTQVREMQCRFRCVACFVAFKRHEYPRAIGYALQAVCLTPVNAAKLFHEKYRMLRAKL